jgi:hypothetical protein
MGVASKRLRLLLRLWVVVFALGAITFLVFPGLTVQALNSAGRGFRMPELPATAAQFWVGLAVSYMVLVTALCLEAQRGGRLRVAPIRFLLLGKASSSLVSLLYFALVLHAFAFLANFVVDGSIVAVTYLLLRQARGEIGVSAA